MSVDELPWRHFSQIWLMMGCREAFAALAQHFGEKNGYFVCLETPTIFMTSASQSKSSSAISLLAQLHFNCN
jgi:hypothetical protein